MPLTQNFTFKLGDSGTVLNTDPALPFVDITRVVGLSNTPYRETERQHEGVDGGFMDAEFEQGRHVILEGAIYAAADSMEDFLDQLKSEFAPVRIPIPFYFLSPGKSERLLLVKPLGMRYDWDAMRRVGTAECQFLMFAEDPRIYTSALQTVVIDVNFDNLVPGFDFGDVGLIGPIRGLVLPGASGDFASTPDTAVLDITGDIDIRADVARTNWTPASEETLVSKYNDTGNQRSFRFALNTNGTLRLTTSTNGTGFQTSSSTFSVDPTESRRLSVRATLDVDDGAGSRVVTFYTGPTVDGPWTQLDQVITSGTTSIFSGTANLEVGSRAGGTAAVMNGEFYAAEVRNGIGTNGTIVANPNFIIQSSGTTSFNDTAGRTWTVNGNAEIDNPSSDVGIEFDFSFGAFVTGNGEDAVNNGNRSTPPILTIDVVNGPLVNPRIFNFTYDRELKMEMSINTGDSLILDPLNRTVRLNGTSNRRTELVVDEWFLLEAGTNFIGFRSDSSDDSTLTVTYRDAWR